MIIFLYGPDTYRSREKLIEFKEKYKKDIDSFGNSLIELPGDEIEFADFNKAINTPSLFVRKRMVIVENIFKNKNKDIIKDILFSLKEENKKDDKDANIIIFWEETKKKENPKNALFKFLKNQKYTQEFKSLSNSQINYWLKKEAKKKGANLNSDAALLLSSFFGEDLWGLSNELNKLINFKKGKTPELLNSALINIDSTDINNLSHANTNSNIFAFIDALSQKNKSLALEFMENEIEAGAVDIYLIHMIIRQFRILLQVKSLQEEGASSKKIISNLKLHPFVLKKAETQAFNFSLSDLRNIFSKMVSIDRDIKLGRKDFKTALSLFIMEFN